MDKKISMIIEFTGKYLIVAGVFVALLYLGSFKFYAEGLDVDYKIASFILFVKTVCGITLCATGVYILKFNRWARLLSIAICTGLGVFSIYSWVTITGTPKYQAIVFYFLPVILLILPKVKEQFKN